MNVNEHIKSTVDLKPHKEALINIMLTSQFINEQINSVLKPFDLSTPQFNVLRILKGQQKKPANLSTIQDRMISKMSNTTRIVDKLIDKGLVMRQICKDNRRKIELFITPQGETLLDQINPEFERQEQEITAGLNPSDLHQLNAYLNKLRTHE